jgi:hypothetical protein
MTHHDFELCPKTYTFFYNEHERTFSLQYLIIEGYHNYLPFWHDSYETYDAYDDDAIRYYNRVGSIEIHNNKIIKIISRIDGGYSDEQVDYSFHHFSHCKSENENGIISDIPDILKLMIQRHPLYKDTSKGTILTKADIDAL